MSNLDIKQRLFSSVGVGLKKEVVIVMPVGGFPVSSTKRFLLDSSVCQGDTDGENVIPIDLPPSISPMPKNTAEYLKGLYDVNQIFNNNSNF